MKRLGLCVLPLFAGMTITHILAADIQQDLFELSLEQLMNVQISDIETNANKRQNSALNVPFSLTIIEPHSYQTPLIQSISDIDTQVSSLVFTEYNKVTPQLFIRGIGSNASGAGDDPSVALLQDGISIPRAGSHNVILHDVDRIEILKGPQGTLYGKGVIGGAVNIVPNRPENLTYTYLTGQLNTVGQGAELIDNTALTNQAANRISLLIQHDNGYVQNSATGKDTGYSEKISAREQFLWHDTTQSARLLVEYNDVKSRDPAQVYRGATPLALFGGNNLTPNHQRTDRVTMPQNGYSDLHNWFTSIDYGNQAGYGRWISNTAFHRAHYDYQIVFIPIAFTPSSNVADEASWMASQELRLEQQAGNWDWYTGIYLSTEKVERNEMLDLRGLISLLGFTPLLTADTPGYTDYNASNTVQNGALFWNARWRFRPTWHLSMGLRQDYVRKDFDLQVSGGDPLNLTLANSEDFTINTDQSWEETSWAVGLDYSPNEDLMYYGLLSTGFKAGSFNSLSTSPLSALASTEPELAFNKEIGVKRFLWDRQLQLQAAIFHIDYRDLQVYTQVDSESNAPEAKIQGAEWDIKTHIWEGLEITANYTYLDTRFKRFIVPTTGADLTNHDLLRAPQQAAALTANYTWNDAKQNRYRIEWNANYSDDFYINPENTAGSRIPARMLSNGALYWMPHQSSLQLAFWIRNITDERYPRHAIDQTPFLYTEKGAAWNMAEPRTTGLSLGWKL